MTGTLPISRGAVVVTGTSSGMGRACSLLLAQAGYTVFAGVRKKHDAQVLKQEGSSGLIPVILLCRAARLCQNGTIDYGKGYCFSLSVCWEERKRRWEQT